MSETFDSVRGLRTDLGPRHLKMMGEGKTITVEVIRSFGPKDNFHRAGEIVALPANIALIVIGSGKAVKTDKSPGKPKEIVTREKPVVSEPIQEVATRKKGKKYKFDEP